MSNVSSLRGLYQVINVLHVFCNLKCFTVNSNEIDMFSFQLVSQLEKELIDRIIDHGCQKAGDLDYNLVHSLYKLVLYFTVVITQYSICVYLPKAMGTQHNLCI
jgi:hypothetical protein